MKLTHTLLLALFTTGFVITSCEKLTPEPDPDPIPTTPAASTTPTFPDADGVLWAVRSTTSVSGFELQVGTAVGLFYENTTNGVMVNAGTVKLNSKSLTVQSNNAYVFTPSATSPTGLDFSGSVIWNVSGANGHTAFEYNATEGGFPTVSAITSGSTVTKADGYTLTCATVTNADSTLFLVGNVSKTLMGNANSCTFTASELSGLATGTQVVQIVPYNVKLETLNSKKYYFGKEDVRQLSVTIK